MGVLKNYKNNNNTLTKKCVVASLKSVKANAKTNIDNKSINNNYGIRLTFSL
jgi:hypothetical protein